MSFSPVQRRGPGRPRDDRREAEILRAVLELVSEKGFDAVSFEEVARRSHASKATLYRRWSNRKDMVVAAVRHGPAGKAESEVDTGSLRGDLLELCARLATTLASADGALITTLLQAGLADPELCDLLERAAGPTGARLPLEVMHRAVARGELPVWADRFAFEEVVGSTLVIRTLNGLPVDESYRTQLVDSVILPALRAGKPPTGGHRGIFSGRPLPGDDRSPTT